MLPNPGHRPPRVHDPAAGGETSEVYFMLLIAGSGVVRQPAETRLRPRPLQVGAVQKRLHRGFSSTASVSRVPIGLVSRPLTHRAVAHPCWRSDLSSATPPCSSTWPQLSVCMSRAIFHEHARPPSSTLCLPPPRLGRLAQHLPLSPPRRPCPTSSGACPAPHLSQRQGVVSCLLANKLAERLTLSSSWWRSRRSAASTGRRRLHS